jgi:TonB family protein
LLPRYHVAAPIDIVILKSGVPETIPGRSIDLGEGGLGAIAASELQPGQSVGVEIFLPEVSQPVRARAQVRYQQRLHCGLQFLGLSRQEQEVLRYWINHAGARPVANNFVEPTQDQTVAPPHPEPPKHHDFLRKRIPRSRRSKRWLPMKWPSRKWLLRLAVLLLLGGAIGWWRWQSGWNELESQAYETEAHVGARRVQVPAAAMAQRLTHRLDPVYPQAAREAGVQGVVILNIVVAPDGAVKSARALSGPEVLTQSAIDAVRWWRFEPYVVDGSPVEAETTVAIDFRSGR